MSHKIAVISFDHWNYDAHIVTALQKKGIESFHIKIGNFKYKNTWERIQNTFSKVFLGKNPKLKKRQDYILEQLKENGFQNQILVINPELIPGGFVGNAEWLYLSAPLPSLTYQFVRMSATSNNQVVQVVLGEGTIPSSYMDDFFNNPTTYVINAEDVLFYFENEGIDIPQGTSRVLCKLKISARKIQQPNERNIFPI